MIGIDRVPARLAFARDKSGAEVVDFSAPENKDVVKTLLEMVPGGVDVAIDAGMHSICLVHGHSRAYLTCVDCRYFPRAKEHDSQDPEDDDA